MAQPLSGEPSLGAGGLLGGLRSRFGGSGGSMADIRSRFSVDTAQMEKLVKGFSNIKKDIQWLHQNLDTTIRKVNNLANSLERAGAVRIGGAGEGATTSTSGAITQAMASTQSMVRPSGGAGGGAAASGMMMAASMFPNFMGGGGAAAAAGGAGAAGGGAAMAAAGAAGGPAGIAAVIGVQLLTKAIDNFQQKITRVINAMDARVDQAYSGMLSRDKLAMSYQQMYGVSNTQYTAQFRRPLQSYLLGEGGINTLLGMQARTGLTAGRQASGIEALRVATGFSFTTEDMARMVETLASPSVNNRLTFTAGTGVYGPGGQQRSIMDVVQSVVKSAGLTNERLVESGMQQGSITRARLTMMGIPEDMQDMILQYARSNIQFQKKTGGRQGMYNPQDPSQRRAMGINNNFAIERERTIRETEERDERFYRRQVDNYAALERNTQRLTAAFAALEDRLSGIIGARISSRNRPELFFPRKLMEFVNPFGDGTATPTKAAGAQAVKMGYNSKTVQTSDLEKNPSFSKLNPKFKERLLSMIAENPNVGIGQGYRSSIDQRTMFLSRYTKTKEDTGVFWNGSFWKKKSGVADAAPPGLSMHEIGLAADLTGDLAWVQANAERFGLKTFAGINNEPWHVQPAELPNGRSAYEKSGAPWGTIPGSTFDPEAVFNGQPGGGEYVSDRAMSSPARKMSLASFSQMSISDQIEALKASNQAGLSPNGTVATAGGGKGKGKRKNGQKATPSNQPLSGREVAQLMYAAGFRGADLVKAVAIAGRESRFNPSAHNPNAQTGDNSYGLMQINMIGKLGPDRRRRLGLKSDDELFDPATNARAAYWLYKAGNNSFYHWGEYKGMEATSHTDLKSAKRYVQQAGFQTGDGMARTTAHSGSVNIEGGQNITIAPNIYIQGTGNSTVDYHRAAKEAARVVSHELRLAALRSS